MGRAVEKGEDHMGQFLAGELKTVIFILNAMGSHRWFHIEHSDDYLGFTEKEVGERPEWLILVTGVIN